MARSVLQHLPHLCADLARSDQSELPAVAGGWRGWELALGLAAVEVRVVAVVVAVVAVVVVVVVVVARCLEAAWKLLGCCLDAAWMLLDCCSAAWALL